MPNQPPASKPAKRVTLLDVAREAGVSRATASLVARKSPLVSDQTRARVEQAMHSLNYVYNLAAARMRAPASRMVGVILPNLANPFFAELLTGIEATLDAAGMVAIIANTRESYRKQTTFIQRMREHGVDGLIVCPTPETNADLLEQASQWNLPIVQALRHVSWHSGDYAGTNYADGMKQATAHLISLGHERIAFVSGNRIHSAYIERLEGFQSTLREHDLADDLVINIPLTYMDGTNVAAFLVNRPQPPTAAVCFNDVVALGFMHGLFELGMTPGADFSVIGFDNIAEANLSRPMLTSVSTYPLEIGQSAAGLLLARLKEPWRDYERVIQPTRLDLRESCMTHGAGHSAKGETTLTKRSGET